MATNVLNFFPVQFSSRTASVFVGRRGNHEYQKSLSEKYPNCTLWPDKTDGDRMYLWSVTESGFCPPTGFTNVTVELKENPFLFERLIQDAVETRLCSLDFQRRGYREFVNFSKGNILQSVQPLSPALHQPIGIYPKIVVDAFFTSFSEKSLVFGLIVDVLYSTRIDVPLDEILSAGVDLSGYNAYVKLLPNSPEAKSHPELARLTIGKIAHIADGWAELDDCRDDKLHRVQTSSVLLEPRREYLNAYLEARYQKEFEKGKPQIAEKFRKLISPAKKYRLVDALVNERLMLADNNGKVKPLALLPNLTACLGKMQNVPSETDFQVRFLQPPIYSFDPTGNQTYSGRVDDGLRKYKPYSKRRFCDKQHHVLVLAPEEYKGTVQCTITKLLKGIQIPERKSVFTGLQDMYDLKELKIKDYYFPINRTAPMRSYQDFLQKALIDAAKDEITYELALLVINDSFKRLPDSENPYYQCKAFLLSSSPAIPTQNLTIEKLRLRDYDLQYILNTVSLACYAKLGGTPYVLKTPEDGPCELIFGVGRSIVKESRFGSGEQTIGFCTVFRANGEYIYNDSTPYCDVSDYSRQLEVTIRRTVEQVAGFEQLEDGARLRLIFHIYKSTGKKEVEAITNAVGKLTRYQIEYALIHVNEDHHFHLFDLECDGAIKGYGDSRYKDTSSALMPKRGTIVTLGQRERLINIIGPEQYRGYGCPTPIRMTLDKSSTYKDADYLARQLFDLSFMNARSLNPGIKPVTILYSEFLADIVGHLRGVQQWSVELIQQKLGRRLWFI